MVSTEVEEMAAALNSDNFELVLNMSTRLFKHFGAKTNLLDMIGDQFHEVGDKMYYFSPGGANQANAERACEELGGVLPEFRTQEEFSQVMSLPGS